MSLRKTEESKNDDEEALAMNLISRNQSLVLCHLCSFAFRHPLIPFSSFHSEYTKIIIKRNKRENLIAFKWWFHQTKTAFQLASFLFEFNIDFHTFSIAWHQQQQLFSLVLFIAAKPLPSTKERQFLPPEICMSSFSSHLRTTTTYSKFKFDFLHSHKMTKLLAACSCSYLLRSFHSLQS